MKMKKLACMATGAALAMSLTVQAEASSSMDQKLLLELKAMLEKQQAQIDKQASEITSLRQKLAGNSEMLTTKASKEDVEKVTEAATKIDKMATSSFSNVDLSFYGHMNRAVLFSDNGDSKDLYSVDNINSQTRLGFKAGVDTTSGWLVGGRVEYGIVSNGSSDVNQFDTHDATSNNFKTRWSEVSFKHDTYGKISLGKGSSATDGTAEVDLSGTDVAAYASIADTAGGMYFNNEDGTPVVENGSPQVGDVFNDFDGLGRTDRVRYDTSSYAGFSLAGSGSSGDAWDGALRYNRKFGETKVVAAFGAASPGDLQDDVVDMQYSGSASVLLPMGLNATVSGGVRDLKDSNRDDPTNWYAKIGYKTSFYSAATTAFAIDYGQTENLSEDDEKGKTWAVTAVHDIAEWGTEFYLTYRNHQLERTSSDYDDVDVVMAGARLKF
ncbi:MAG: hypothetical protein GY799_32675 [Desulfobulbaceae bacterium]|nr:hypothetical protein [Desulfobulbaceae bacterium]